MKEPEVLVICLEPFRELYDGQVWAGFRGLDTLLPQGLAVRLEAARKVSIPGAGAPPARELKPSARAQRPSAEKE